MIFYLVRDKPLENGILDMEKLNERINTKGASEKILCENYQLGPFQIDGNNEFTVVFRDNVS